MTVSSCLNVRSFSEVRWRDGDGRALGEVHAQHHFLEEDEVSEGAQVLEPLTLELGEPAEGLRQTEKAVLGLLLATVAAGAVISAALCTFAIECRADYATIWPGQIPRV